MVCHCDEIGVEGLNLGSRARHASQHAQEVGCVTIGGIGRDGSLARFAAAKGCDEDGHGTHGADVGGLAARIIVGQERQAGAEALGDRQALGGGEQHRHEVGGSDAGGTQLGADRIGIGRGIKTGCGP